MSIQAINTEFDGRHFRSRLEARWAVFFKAMGIECAYEPEGYVVRGTPYLPDFYIPSLDCFIEIKGVMPESDQENKALPTCAEREKADGLAEVTGKPVFIFYGDIPDDDGTRGDSAEVHLPDGYGGILTDNYWHWTYCDGCDSVDITHAGNKSEMRHGPFCGGGYHSGEKLRMAYRCARSARF